jgi:hypothetical protein
LTGDKRSSLFRRAVSNEEKKVFATLALGIRQNSGNQILMSNSKLCRFSFLYLSRRFIGRLLGFRLHEIEETQSLKILIKR